MGHTFGISEQIFQMLAPPEAMSSPFRLTTRPTWECSAGCSYRCAARVRALSSGRPRNAPPCTFPPCTSPPCTFRPAPPVLHTPR
eukprot:5355412-Prymnesium_polylepis.1